MLANFDLNNTPVVVTGGSGLLGSQYCKAIEAIGGIPINLDIVPPKRNNYDFVECDITKEAQVKWAYRYVRKEYGPIHGLINNAAIDPKFDKSESKTCKARFEHYALDQWKKEIDVGLTGAFLCTKYFGLNLRKDGSIINISSLLGVVAPNQNLYKKPDLRDNEQPVKPVTYSVIKHGIIGLTRYTATYLAGKPIRCNALAPNGVYNGHTEEFVQTLSKLIPMGRMAKKDEYNSAIQFLLSNASSYMTGQVLVIDGGHSTW